jgi:hypothetical protein
LNIKGCLTGSQLLSKLISTGILVLKYAFEKEGSANMGMGKFFKLAALFPLLLFHMLR